MHAALSADHALALAFALLTALANALALMTQHLASTRARATTKGWALAWNLARQPLWLAGWIGLVASLVFQALALHFGPLAEVQPLLVSELVMSLVLRRLWLNQRVSRKAWWASALTVGGLALFLGAGNPTGRILVPATSSWRLPIVVCLLALAALVALARTGTPARRAASLGAATGVAWALEATLIKAVTNTLVESGVRGALTHWTIYGFVLVGVTGLLVEQAALHVGPLRASQPLIVTVDPVVSVVLGLWLYGETLHPGVAHLALTGLGLAVAVAGVVALTQSVPSTMLAELGRR